MEILLSEEAYQRWWPRVEAIAPHATANRLADDGTWSVGTVEGAEVAWGTGELWDLQLVRPFFGGLLHASSLRWFQSMAAGFDDPVYARLRDNGVRVTSAHVNAAPIAEFVLWAALDHVLDGPRMRRDEATSTWNQLSHRELAGTTLTIVGMGAIGHETAVRARALAMTVRGVRRRPSGDEPVDAMFHPDQLAEALSGADVVALATPLDETTRGIAGADFFAAMAPSSLFVNVGRGGLVDEAALLAALDAGRPGRATLDVFVDEPLPTESTFWTDERVTVTPHIAGKSLGNGDRLAELFCTNLAAYLRGEVLQHEV